MSGVFGDEPPRRRVVVVSTVRRPAMAIGLLLLLPPLSPAENVSWTDAAGVSVSGNSLTKVGSAGWNEGAVSTRFMASGDGYVEFTAVETNTARMAGLGNGDTSLHYSDIEYAVYLRADATVQVYESGFSKGSFGTHGAGDRFRVGVESGVVKYRKNGAVFYTSALGPTYPLLVDTSIYTTGATLSDVVLVGDLQENVSWTDVVGVTASQNSLTKTGGTTGWNAGAISSRALASGDGYVEFTAAETNTYRMAGLGVGDASQHYADIEYAIYLRADGTVKVYESGTSRGSFGAYANGDRFRVGVESGVVRYRKNGTVFCTSAVLPTYPLLVDSSLYTTGATLTNLVFAGNLQEDVSWTDVLGVSASVNNLVKTGGTTGWNVGAVSTKVIASGDGYVEFTAAETTTHRMAGLGSGDVSQHYSDIEYAVDLRADGTVKVYEAGLSRGSFGTYAAEDRFRVGVESGVVRYRKNGMPFYTSTVLPTYPLLVDTSLYSIAATIGNVVLAGDLQENVSWNYREGVSSAPLSELTKTAATGNWDSGADSTRAIASGDGYMEFTATETTTARMAGLAHGSYGGPHCVTYAIYLTANGQAWVSGCPGTYLVASLGTYVQGDRFRVGVEGGVVKYRKNGRLLYANTCATCAPAYPLIASGSFFTAGASVANVVLSGNLREEVFWSVVEGGVSPSGNSVIKTGTTGWNTGAVNGVLDVADRYVEFTATENNTARMLGLSGGSSPASTAIAHAIYLRSDGIVEVYEDGASRGSFGAYVAGDRLRVGIESGVVKYRKNRTLLYTSSGAPVNGVVRTALYTTGATVTNVVTGWNPQ